MFVALTSFCRSPISFRQGYGPHHGAVLLGLAPALPTNISICDAQMRQEILFSLMVNNFGFNNLYKLYTPIQKFDFSLFKFQFVFETDYFQCRSYSKLLGEGGGA